MKTIRILIFALLSLVAAVPVMASPGSEAGAVLIRYFDALRQGDILSLRTLMAGDLLKKRLRLLDNSTYSTFLIKTFSNVHFRIDSIDPSDPSRVIIDASIIFDPDNISQHQFILRKTSLSPNSPAQFYIYDDNIPNLN